MCKRFDIIYHTWTCYGVGNMKFKCRKCGIVFTILDAQPSDVTALNQAPCGAGYGTPFHEVRGHVE